MEFFSGALELVDARYWGSVVVLVVVVAACVKRLSLGDERMCAFRFISYFFFRNMKKIILNHIPINRNAIRKQ